MRTDAELSSRRGRRGLAPLRRRRRLGRLERLGRSAQRGRRLDRASPRHLPRPRGDPEGDRPCDEAGPDDDVPGGLARDRGEPRRLLPVAGDARPEGRRRGLPLRLRDGPRVRGQRAVVAAGGPLQPEGGRGGDEEMGGGRGAFRGPAAARLTDLTFRQILSGPAPERGMGGPPMQMNDMILVSIDDHVCEPPDMFQRHVPAKWKDRAPRLLTKEDGTDAWFFENQQIPNVGLNAVVGRPPDEYGMEPTTLSQLRKGCWNAKARVDDMNANGVLGSMCFGSMTGFTGELFARAQDKELALTMTQAYNDWHIDEWCGSAPGRFIPLALPMLWDPKLTAAEIRRVAKKGCHAITFPDVPTGLGYPSLHSDHWNPIWEACNEEGTVICVHIGSGTGMNLQDATAPVEIMITGTPITLFNFANEITYSKFLPRYKNLRFALSEAGTG